MVPQVAQPHHTFFRHNSVEASSPSASTANQTLKVPFDWLVHLDRQVVSPMELLTVSAFKPHELTQQFVINSGGDLYHKHLAPWDDPAARIYRVFEFLEARNQMAGMTLGGRQPGKININNIWDVEVFRALCDPQQANHFYDSTNPTVQVDTIYNQMIALRSPGGVPGPSDRPFWPLSTGYTTAGADAQNPNGIGVENTLLRRWDPAAAVGSQRLFEVTGQTHPHIKNQLLTKIYNNVTTRSNVFALWLTVGFFEVYDNTTTPPLLGQELGKDKAQNLRHHMFAVLDRSALTIANTGAPLTTATNAVTSPGTATINLSTPVAPGAGIDAAGAIVTIDDSTNRETVVVTAVAKDASNNTTAFAAKFSKPHAAGVNIYSNVFGNPGPQPTFLPKDNSAIVPYWVVID